MAVNPFSTRFVRPGAIEYLFTFGLDAAALIDRLQTQRWRGAIVGPHGSGKSTLLATLRPHLIAAGKSLIEHALHAGERRLPAAKFPQTPTANTLIVVDGYEQLDWLARRRLRREVAASGAGLLVTSHRKVSLPLLFSTAPTEADGHWGIARRLVANLQRDHRELIMDSDVRQALAHHADNLREALFELYDLYEQRGRDGRVGSSNGAVTTN